MNDLTPVERRLVLGALWTFMLSVGSTFDDTRDDSDPDDIPHELATMELCDSAARKLGGDPGRELYGAADYGV